MRIKVFLILVLLVSITIPVNVRAAEESVPTFRQEDIVPGELIVIMKEGGSVRSLALPEKARAATKKHKGLEKLHAGVINVPVGEESAYIAKLKKQKDVLVVEPNYIVKAEMLPDDTLYPLQYGPALIQAPTAWDTTTGSGSVTIAIIDSGIDSSHPEFAGRLVSPYDFLENDTVPQDECGHGTHVAGIAAAAGNNGQGVAGIAWEVKIMPLRILAQNCGGSFADMADALVWAADHGADVINLSVGSSSSSTLLQNATYYAYTHGAAIFAASGNSGGAVLYPAAYPWVMAVGSVDATSTRVFSSNQGTALDLMAPGDLIYSTLPTQPGFYYNAILGKSPQYDYLSGTSMASPHAAGAAALLASIPGGCFDTPDQIYQALTASALDLEGAGRDDNTGYGLIQIAEAMLQCSPAPPLPPSFATQYDFASSADCSNLVKYGWRSTNTGLVSPGDSNYRNTSLPFTFDYADNPYTTVNIHANGFISLGNSNISGTEGNYQNNFLLPGIALPNNFLAPFWDDLTDSTGAGLYTAIIGTAPNREFVIEYKNMQRMRLTPDPSDLPSMKEVAPGTYLQFEVVLFESTNQILYQYRNLSGAGSDGSSATVGVEYGNGLGATEYSYNLSSLREGLALLFAPYASGSPTLPSDVCPGTKAVTIPAGNASACQTSPTTFDVDIAAGALPYDSVLRVQQLSSAPAMPGNFRDLKHYADIRLTYPPPVPSLQPMPEVYVCYQYTARDVLDAGGHPENLFIAARDHITGEWNALPTSVDSANSRLLARAPHFSFYGVATLNPQQRLPAEKELGLPVTGAPFDNDWILFLILVGFIFLPGGIWLKRKAK